MIFLGYFRANKWSLVASNMAAVAVPRACHLYVLCGSSSGQSRRRLVAERHKNII